MNASSSRAPAQQHRCRTGRRASDVPQTASPERRKCLGRPVLPRRCRNASGLATLEWLLIVAAAGGFAAVMAAGLDQIIVDQGAQPADVHGADVTSRIAVAHINDRAVATLAAIHAAQVSVDAKAVTAGQARLDRLRHECEVLDETYPSAIRLTEWRWQSIPINVSSPDAVESGTGRTAGRWTCTVKGRPR